MDSVRNIQDVRAERLAAVLLDSNASVSERDDAAMDLGEINSDVALDALVKTASSRFERDDIVLASCGESIASIWLARGRFDSATFTRLAPVAQAEARALMKARRPEWLTDDS